MRKLLLLLFCLLGLGTAFQSCDDTKTYAEQLEDQRKAIRSFINEQSIVVISEEDFLQDTITDVEKNEYVLLSNGVYMQIVERGTGDTIKSGDILTVRLIEYGLIGKDTLSTIEYSAAVDAFRYTNYSGTISGSFDRTSPGWFQIVYYNYYYSSIDVPAGWVSAVPFIRDDAHVKLIVPAALGHLIASSYVYPYYYDLRRIRKY